MLKQVIISGASGGLGGVVSKHLLSQGFDLIPICRDEKSAAAWKEKMGASGKNSSIYMADLTDVTAIEHMAATYPGVYGLVHLAGGFEAANTFGDSDSNLFDQMLKINTNSTYHLLRVFMPVLSKNKMGSIVTIGAKAARYPDGLNAAYAASKAALISLTLSAAAEGKRNHVRANVLLPGIIRTAANESWGDPEKMKRWTTPEDIAQSIGFLMSDASAGVNGNLIEMFGGL